MAEGGNTHDALGKFSKFLDPVPEEKLAEMLKKNLGETPEIREKCLRRLKAMINEKNVACITTDDFLLRFLRFRKFDVERSFEALLNYVLIRVKYHEVLMEMNPDVVKELLRLGIAGVLPYRDSEDRAIIFVRSGVWNSSVFPESDLPLVAFLFLNYVSEKVLSQATGIIILFDTKLFNFYNDCAFLREARSMKSVLLNSCTARYKMAHVLNETPLAKFLAKLLFKFISKKLRDRVLFHGEETEILFEHVCPTILPNEFGGNSGPLNTDHLIKVMDDYMGKLKNEQQFFFK